jgi:hypothetical protein
MRKRLIRNVVLTASCLAVTVVVPAPSAIAQTGSIAPVGATLLAKGAAVRITFTYTCENFFPSQQFQLTQRAGSSLAKGTSRFLQVGSDLVCNNMQHTGQVDIAAEDNRFKQGPAHVSETGGSFSNEIQITK